MSQLLVKLRNGAVRYFHLTVAIVAVTAAFSIVFTAIAAINSFENDAVRALYDQASVPSGRVAGVSVEVASVSPVLPDLYISDIYYIADLSFFGSNDIQFIVCNKGTADTGRMFSSTFYIEELPGVVNHENLAPGVCTRSWTTISGYIGQTVTIRVITDYHYERIMFNNVITESDETNNELTKRVTIPRSAPPSIILLYPNGAEIWQVGKEYEIRWSSSSLSPTIIVGISLIQKNPTDTYIPVSITTANLGNYKFTIPNDVLIGSYFIKIDTCQRNDAKIDVCGGPNAISDTSDTSFKIVPQDTTTKSDLVVEAVKNGATSERAFLVNICNKGRMAVKQLTLRVIVNKITRDSLINEIVLGSNACTTRKFFSTFWDMQAGHNYTAKLIVDPRNEIAESDEYNNNTTGMIGVPIGPLLRLLSPNGGDVWEIGKTYEVRWESEKVESTNVYIVLNLYSQYWNDNSNRGGSYNVVKIKGDVGSYNYTVAADVPPHNDYILNIQRCIIDTDGESLICTYPAFPEQQWDTSDEQFSIVVGSSTVSIPPDTISDIQTKATQLKENNLEPILTELKLLRNLVQEQQTEIKYLKSLTNDLAVRSSQAEEAIRNFITYGVDENTKKLGAGERAAVMHSYKSAFDKLPETESELTDAIKIANGRWPSEESASAEARAMAEFRKIYNRDPNLKNLNDDAAITIMAYGLRQRAENRNLKSEAKGILTFKWLYSRTPQSTEDWNIVQAITYSGAKR